MALPSGLPEHVDDNEELARFLTSSKYFSSRGIKQAAFLPNPKNNETSVFRHGTEPIEDLKAIAQKELGHTPLNIHGAAIVKAAAIRRANLEVQAHEPPPRHANIINWPTTDDQHETKAQQKQKALLIAQAAKPPILF